MPFGFGPSAIAGIKRRESAPPPTGNVRWISPTGTGDGSAVGSPAPLSSLNAQVLAAGPGGEVRLRGDLGEYVFTGTITLSAGGIAGAPVRIRGTDASGNPVKATVRGSRTNPWPTTYAATASANDGNLFIDFISGANFLTFQSLHLRDFGTALRFSAQLTGITLGSATYRDSAVAAYLNHMSGTEFFNLDDPGYLARVNAIYAASEAGVSADIQTWAVDGSNVNRFQELGTSNSTANWVRDFQVYGGVYRGTGRGFFRFRGPSVGLWMQDVDMDAGGVNYPAKDNQFATGVEMNSAARDAVFLRCIANGCWETNPSRTYGNGDGFAGELENYNVCFVRCQADNNMDGGIDTKASACVVIGIKAEGNRRNLRFWGSADAHHVNLINPVGRQGGNANQVYTWGTKGQIRIWSGTCSTIYDGSIFQGDGTYAFLAVGPDVTVTRNTSITTLYQRGASTGFVGAFNPADASLPTFTSSGTRSVAEGASDVYQPAVSKPYNIVSITGPDAGRITRDYLNLTLAGQYRSAPVDANGDNVYTYTVEVMDANRNRVSQTVNVTVGVAPALTIDVIDRMGTAGAAPDSARTAVYQPFINTLINNGIGLKTQSLIVPKVHAEPAARIHWIGNGLSADGTRTFPTHIVDKGYTVASTAAWCYWGGANNTFTKVSQSSIAVAAWIETLPPRVGGANAIGDVFGWDETYIRCDSDGAAYVKLQGGAEIKVANVLPGMVYADRQGDTVRIYKGTELVYTGTQTQAAMNAVRPRFCARPNGNSAMTGTVAMSWIGAPLSGTELNAFVTSLTTMFGAIDNVFISPQPVSLPANPKIAVLGASRFRQMANSTSLAMIEGITRGFFEWARFLCNSNITIPAWAATSNVNSFGMNGYIFAADGDSWGNMEARVNKILASDADVVIINSSISGIQWGVTVGSYCDTFKALINRFYGKKFVVVDQLWERADSAGGVWDTDVNGGIRALYDPINAEMLSWCTARGIPVLPIREVLIDTAATIPQPRAGLTHDGTHTSTLGGYEAGKVIAATLAAALPPSAAIPAADRAGNFITNALMAGTAGTLTNITGQLADGYSAAKQGTVVTVAAAKISKVPANTTRFGSTAKTWQQFTIGNTAALGATAREGLAGCQFPVSGLTVGKWYEGRVKVEVDASDSFGGVRGVFSAGNAAAILSQIDGGGGTGTGFWAAGVLPWPKEAFSGWMVSFPFQATQTTGNFSIQAAAVQGTQNVVIRFTDVEFREIADPNLLMYDESDTDPVSFLSPNTFEVDEEDQFSTTVEVSEYCAFSLSGTDAARFTINNDGVITGGPFDYEQPLDSDLNNVYTFTVTATPYNTTKSAATQTITVTVRDINDGFYDFFTGVDGTDIAINNPLWQRVSGAQGAITIQGNASRNNLSVTNSTYLAPQQGDQRNQRVRFRVTSVSNRHSVLVLWESDTEHLYASNSGGQLRIGATSASQGNIFLTTTPYKSWATTDYVDVILEGNIMSAYQNGVFIGSLDVGTRCANGRRSGLRSTMISGSNNPLDDFNCRAYNGGYIPKIGLLALGMTPLTGTVGTPYAGMLSNRTQNSTITLQSVTGPAGGTWIADGDFIRGIDLVAGSYTVVVKENVLGAVNDGRTTSFNVIIS